MAELERARDLSLVPYSSRDSNGIILRHNDAVVIYDKQARQLVLRGPPPSNTSSIELNSSDCPYCHRSFREERHHERDHVGRTRSNTGVEADFVSPEYFHMLQSYPLPPGTDVAAVPPASPQLRLARPAESTREDLSHRELQESADTHAPTSSSSHSISADAFTPNYFSRFFVEESVLGKGGKGVVLLVNHYLDGVFLGRFACKRVPVGDDHEWLKKVLIEVVLLQQLSHQNLVSYRHVWLENAVLTTFGPSVPCAFILQQYCNKGDLQHYVYHPTASATTEERKSLYRRRSKGQVDHAENSLRTLGLMFDEIFSFFRDITAGLSYLHLNGFIHRDLKPSNCLLHQNGGDIRVLVSDFGEAQETNKKRRSTGATGTISYCAPEVLRAYPPDGRLGEFTTKSDIFSLGMILYFMCFGHLPYQCASGLNEEEEDLDQLREEITAWSGFDDGHRSRSDLPDELYRFLKRLLSANPTERPSADEIVRGIGAGSGLGEQSHPINNLAGISDEIHHGSRISPIDTPESGTPSAQWHARNSSSSSTSHSRSGKTKLRPTSLTRKSSDTDPFNIRMSDGDDHANTSSLVLRKSYSPSVPSSPHRVPPPALVSPPPLAPTTPQSSPERWRLAVIFKSWLQQQTVQAAIRMSLLVLKLLFMQQSCSPFAVEPRLFYLLVCLAALDLAGGGLPLPVSFALTALHLSVLYASYHLEVLCRPDQFH